MSAEFDPYHRWLGIPPEEQPADHYRLLGLARFEADPEVIRDAAERQMRHVRSYALGKHRELSQRILNELGAAKACLLDPEKKARYEDELRAATAAPSAPEPLPATVADWDATLAIAPRKTGPTRRVPRARSATSRRLASRKAGTKPSRTPVPVRVLLIGGTAMCAVVLVVAALAVFRGEATAPNESAGRPEGAPGTSVTTEPGQEVKQWFEAPKKVRVPGKFVLEILRVRKGTSGKLPVLMVELQVSNISSTELDFRGWDTASGNATTAALTDDAGSRVPGLGDAPPVAQSLAPQSTVTQTLQFAQPKNACKKLHLVLPGAALGRPAAIGFEIPSAIIGEASTEPLEAPPKPSGIEGTPDTPKPAVQVQTPAMENTSTDTP